MCSPYRQMVDAAEVSLIVVTTISVAAVPVTHGYVGHRLHKDAWNSWRFRNIFFSGGKRFIVFQGLSWSFFAGAIVGVVLALSGQSRKTPEKNPQALFGASICSAFISEVLMVSSLFTYHRGHPKRQHRRMPSMSSVYFSTTGTSVVTVLCCALALVGTGILLIVHHSLTSRFSRIMFTTLALVCFAVAVPVTHGVGGRLKWALTGTWSFWQPYKGGLCFMLLQSFGWACFALSVVGCVMVVAVVLHTSSAALLGGGHDGIKDIGVRVVAASSWIAGLSGFAAQILTACSLLHFQPHTTVAASPAQSSPTRGSPSRTRPTPPGSPGSVAQLHAAAAALGPNIVAVEGLGGEGLSSWRGFLEMLLVLHVIHAPHLILIAIIATVIAVAPNLSWSATIFSVLAAAYSPTFVGSPGATGLRSWTRFQIWATRVVENAARRWHGECRVLRDGDSWHFHEDSNEVESIDHDDRLNRIANAEGCRCEDDKEGAAPGKGQRLRRVIFGYHPHGMFPAAACWFHLTPQFASLFPTVPPPVTLGASVIFRVPLLRDVAMWAGARNVSRKVFVRSLRERGAVVMCPGGQAELVEHVGGEGDNEVTLCTRHKGFIRIAIEQGAHLVPVFVFGESQATRNLFKWKAAQRWTYKRFGFPMPFLPGGFKGFLPLPAPLPLSFVVGEPLAMPLPGPDGQAVEADVDKVSELYYRRIENLFTRYKAESGYAHLRLVLKHD